MQVILSKIKAAAIQPRLRDALWFATGIYAGAAIFRIYYYYAYIKF